jgi:hypothetical protein
MYRLSALKWKSFEGCASQFFKDHMNVFLAMQKYNSLSRVDDAAVETWEEPERFNDEKEDEAE